MQKLKNKDERDLQILRLLETNARISTADLAKQVGMSAPGVADRLRKLEAAGVIRGFTTDIDIAALGYTLEAIVRVKPRPGNLHVVEKMIVDEPRFTACDKVTGDDCFIARLAIRDITEIDDILGLLHEKAETNTAIIKSSPIRPRMPE